ncbi:MAG: hypothetical protein K8M05_09335 [Deltaproteobacteria bacterium]|nr:hypothetical protein [Kofleriaceae bacterium]
MHRAGILVLLALLTACPKDASRSGSTRRDEVVVPTPPSPVVDDPGPFRPSTVALRADAVAPETLDWAHPVMTRMALEKTLIEGTPPTGRIVVSFEHGGWEPYDADAKALVYRAHGLEGMDLDPPVAFVADPPIMIGSLPGPMGGSVSLRVSDLRASASVVRETAEAVLDGDADDPVVTQFLIEVGQKRATSDGADYWSATLHGVRLVRLGARLVLLEGTPRDLGR